MRYKVLVIALLLCLIAACGGDQEAETDTGATVVTETTEPTATDTAPVTTDTAATTTGTTADTAATTTY